MSMSALLALLLTPQPDRGPDLGEIPACMQRADQARAFEARRDGRVLPLSEIERRVLPQMAGAQYLGPEMDPETGIYTLKFLRNGTVVWLLIDGRSGQIIQRRGF